MYMFQVASEESGDGDNYSFISFRIDTSSFLMVGTRNDGNRNVNVLIIMDHFTRYAAAYVVPKQHQ